MSSGKLNAIYGSNIFKRNTTRHIPSDCSIAEGYTDIFTRDKELKQILQLKNDIRETFEMEEYDIEDT